MTVHNVRRVVTAHAPDGRAIFVEDGPPPRTLELDYFPGDEFFMIWSSDDTPVVPAPTNDPTIDMESFSPGVGGTRFLINRWPPQSVYSSDQISADRARESQHALPGITERHESVDAQMHETDTVDYGIVISGEIWLELDDGETRRLSAGDCVIQNGTRHAWRNRSDEECVMAFVMVGARRGGAG